MVKGNPSKEKTLSAYPLSGQPLGSSLPYVPQARPWDAPQLTAPPLQTSGVRNQAGRANRADTTDAKDQIIAAAKAPVDTVMRPTASVTDIPGASAPAKRLEHVGSFKAPGKGLQGAGAQRIHIEESESSHLNDEASVQHIAFPAIMWFIVGVFCPPFLCCGLRFLRSANAVARLFGAASVFMLCVYFTLVMILIAQ